MQIEEMIMRKSLMLGTAVVSTLVLGLAGSGAAYWKDWVGGPGGATNYDFCPRSNTRAPFSASVRGFNLFRSEYIDALQPVCNPGPANSRQTTLPWRGAEGGEFQSLLCKPGEPMSGLATYVADQLVTGVALICDRQYNHFMLGPFPRYEYYQAFGCAEGEMVTAIASRSGNYIDALAFKCGPKT
jgi:hypothetical protein